MRLLVLDENYPHLGNLMGDVFVHVRVKEYLKTHEVRVFSYFHEDSRINYEGVELFSFSALEGLVKAIHAYKPDRLLIHFYQSWMLESILRDLRIPVIIWVHGYEALGWYRRLFNYTKYSPVFFRYILRNTVQQWHFRRLIKYANFNGRLQFVFVSNWMKQITEQDSVCKIKNSAIIPNPIDLTLFDYNPKAPESRFHVLLLRSFSSRKYANDISVKAMQILSRHKEFAQFKFTIIGTGSLFEKTLAPIRHFENVSIENRMVRQMAIPDLHKAHGVFLCPTRQDAQGVSMCEAMSSGLVPITSDNTAIPEFVRDGVSGFLTHSADEIAEALLEMAANPQKFQQMSMRASQSIRNQCELQDIAARELSLIEKI